MSIYVTRHGQTDWNVQKKVMGRHDEPLNATGLAQAATARDNLAHVSLDLIVCSPLLRAKQTAEVINANRHLPIIYDPSIIERDFGEFEGLLTTDFDFSGFWNYYQNSHFQRAENIQAFFARVYDFLTALPNKYPNQNILIVTHGGVSIPISCFFRQSIPQGSLIEANLALHNCQVASYL